MDEQLLERLGLTKGEIKVYLALNKLGESTVGPIGKESGVSKSKIYDILDRLIEKGLAGHISKNGTKHFTANDPHMILEYAEKQKEELELTKEKLSLNLLPQLLLQRKTATTQSVAELYEGFKGLKAVRDELMRTLNPGDELLIQGAPKIANEKWEGWLLGFHKEREERKVGMRIIYNSDAKKYGAIRKKWKLTKVRYMTNDLSSPNWIDVYPGAVLFGMILKEPIAFVVRDKELAKSFRAYFEIMWKNSKQ